MSFNCQDRFTIRPRSSSQIPLRRGVPCGPPRFYKQTVCYQPPPLYVERVVYQPPPQLCERIVPSRDIATSETISQQCTSRALPLNRTPTTDQCCYPPRLQYPTRRNC
ncbi:hypothetical protein ACOME3_001533 [Neoechinorhynchus agilis]